MTDPGRDRHDAGDAADVPLLSAGEEVLLGDLKCRSGDPEPARDKIEPYLAVLLQAEHLNLLVGSGLTNGLADLANFKDGADMAAVTGGGVGSDGGRVGPGRCDATGVAGSSPAAGHPGCSAILGEPQIPVVLALSRAGRPVGVLGHADGSFWRGEYSGLHFGPDPEEPHPTDAGAAPIVAISRARLGSSGHPGDMTEDDADRVRRLLSEASALLGQGQLLLQIVSLPAAEWVFVGVEGESVVVSDNGETC